MDEVLQREPRDRKRDAQRLGSASVLGHQLDIVRRIASFRRLAEEKGAALSATEPKLPVEKCHTRHRAKPFRAQAAATCRSVIRALPAPEKRKAQPIAALSLRTGWHMVKFAPQIQVRGGSAGRLRTPVLAGRRRASCRTWRKA